MGYRRDSGSFFHSIIGKHDQPATGEKDRDRQITKAYFRLRYCRSPKGAVYLFREEV